MCFFEKAVSMVNGQGSRLAACLLLLLLSIAPVVYAQDNRLFIIDNDRFNYASFLLKQGHSFAAAKEFGRLMEQFPFSPHIPAESYFKGMSYNDAIKEPIGFPQPFSNLKTPIKTFEHMPDVSDIKIKAVQILLFKGKTYEDVEQEIARLKDSGINTIIVRVFHNRGDRFHPFVNPAKRSLPLQASGLSSGKTEFVPLDVSKEEDRRIRRFLTKWRKSWEGKKLNDYMNCYSMKFKSKGMDWNAWKRHKTSLNKIKSKRKVLIRDIKVLKQDNDYIASFMQHYTGEGTNDTGIKRLYLKFIKDDIKIIAEEWNAISKEEPAGIAEGLKIEAGVYFETKHAPVVEDILGKITEFSHKNGLKIFAWMTTRYADYGIEDKTDLRCKSYDIAKNKIAPCKGLDLFNDEAVLHLENIYKDLARYNIDGILFQDDLYLKHNEGFGRYADALYLMETGKVLDPKDINIQASGRHYTSEFWKWAGWKNKRLSNVAKRLMQAVKEINPKTKFSINLMYESVSNPVYALAWLSQNIDESVAAGFDYYAVMAYHIQMQDELKKEPFYIEWLIEKMTREAVERVGSPSKVIMKVQTIDWNTRIPLPDKEIIDLLKRINSVNNVSLAVVPYRIDFPFDNIGKIGK